VVAPSSSGDKDKKLIEKIEIDSSEQKTVLSLHMPVDAHYSVYSLEEPDRIVLQINDMDYADALPALEDHPQITNIRKRRDENGNFIFVMESSSPLSIVNSGYQQTGDSYKLQVTLLPGQKPSKSMAASHSLKLAGPEVPASANEASTRGDLVKILHQPRLVDPADKMLSEGLALYESGQVAEALDKLYAVVKSNESHVRARATLAVILVEQGQGGLAITLLEDGLSQYPEQAAWSRLLGRIHMDAGNLSIAREVLSRTMPAITADPEYHALYAAVLQKMALHNDAAVTYRNLVNVQPDNGLWWMGLAISLEAIARNKDALFAYKNALNGQLLTPETHRYIVERIRYLDNRDGNESS
jgi:tetratricopeptide (TPR) repeat protein